MLPLHFVQILKKFDTKKFNMFQIVSWLSRHNRMNQNFHTLAYLSYLSVKMRANENNYDVKNSLMLENLI